MQVDQETLTEMMGILRAMGRREDIPNDRIDAVCKKFPDEDESIVRKMFRKSGNYVDHVTGDRNIGPTRAFEIAHGNADFWEFKVALAAYKAGKLAFSSGLDLPAGIGCAISDLQALERAVEDDDPKPEILLRVRDMIGHNQTALKSFRSPQ